MTSIGNMVKQPTPSEVWVLLDERNRPVAVYDEPGPARHAANARESWRVWHYVAEGALR